MELEEVGQSKPLLQKCHHCGKALKGRSDKKYCDDFCRNEYNNKLKFGINAPVKRINAILTRNRKLLSEFIATKNGSVKIKKMKLDCRNFNFNFYTHTDTDNKGRVFFFCYDYGYSIVEEKFLILRIESHYTEELSKLIPRNID